MSLFKGPPGDSSEKTMTDSHCFKGRLSHSVFQTGLSQNGGPAGESVPPASRRREVGGLRNYHPKSGPVVSSLCRTLPRFIIWIQVVKEGPAESRIPGWAYAAREAASACAQFTCLLFNWFLSLLLLRF